MRHLAGPTLLAVMAILAGSSGLPHAGTAPGLVAVAAASLAVFSDDVSTTVYGPASKPGDAPVAMGFDIVVDGRTEQGQLSLFHLVLPPPAT